MNDYQNSLELNGISKKYKDFSLQNVSFALPKGYVMGFVGQNGAGKTTTMKAILNMISYDGEIKIFGEPATFSNVELKNRIGVVFDDIIFSEFFNAVQVGRFLKGIYKEWDTSAYNGFVKRFSLPPKKKIKDYSRGMKMKLQIATALSHNAELLILDEATSGLDPIVRSEILDMLMEFMQDENHSILLSSHILSDIERIADYITFIDRGKVLLCGEKTALLEQYGVLKCGADDVLTIDKADYVSIRKHSFGCEILVKNKAAAKTKYPDFVVDSATLEDIMIFCVREGASI